jgi:DNA-binding transcriptional LysR family regulator
VIGAVASFDVDVGFVEGAQTHPDLLVTEWLTDELVLFTGPSHVLAGASVSFRELRDASWIMRELGSGTREAADRWLTEALGHLRVEFELGSSEAIKRVVASGLGIGCLSRYAVAEAFEQGWLVPLKTRLPKAVRRLALVTHHSKHLGPGMTAFLKHCAGEPAQAPASLPRKRAALRHS